MNKKKKIMQVNLRTKLIVAFVAMLVIPTILVGVMSYFTAKDEMEQKIVESATENIRILDNILDNELEPRLTEALYFTENF